MRAVRRPAFVSLFEPEIGHLATKNCLGISDEPCLVRNSTHPLVSAPENYHGRTILVLSANFILEPLA
jgi:hypothetical protein